MRATGSGTWTAAEGRGAAGRKKEVKELANI